MEKINNTARFFLNLGKTQSILNHRFDRGLGGLGFNEFLILVHLDQSGDEGMRRVDLAEKVGMTASGVTRLLLPMEKVHLIKSGPVEQDARVRSVQLAPAGRERLTEALMRLDELAEDIIPEDQAGEIEAFSKLLVDIGGRALMM